MGNRGKKKRVDDSAPSSSSSSDDSDLSSRRRSRHRKDNNGSSRREKDRKRERSNRDRERKKRHRDRDRDRERERKRRKLKRDGKRRKAYDSDSDDGSRSGSESDSGHSSSDDPKRNKAKIEPEAVVAELLEQFPDVGNDLKQLLKMIDDGQAVDINGLSEKLLIKKLKKLFCALNLKESGDRVFLLPSKIRPTLDVVGHLIETGVGTKEEEPDHPVAVEEEQLQPSNVESGKVADGNIAELVPEDAATGPRRRVLGPEMPSTELLAAAAKLTEAQEELREAELEEDTELFIGPAPPAVVAEAASANEAERFEEVTRIMAADVDSPYDILGVNHNMSADNMKKRYWKMSLLVHPDKCPHPQAHQAFIKLNKAFKELQDPDKRKGLDDKIKLKEEQEKFKIELKAMREAAQWRRLQGISMEGDDELLAEFEVKVAPKREEWMTTLPPERKPGVTMQTTRFSMGTKEGRGDTSSWTDTPSDRAQKAKMNYLEAYNEAAALASNADDKKKSGDAELVDQYNKERRSKSLVQKHQEEAGSRSKKKLKQKSKQHAADNKEEWAGQHPWKPWDREKDLTAGRQSVKLDAENMTQGLTSRFSSGNIQRSFL